VVHGDAEPTLELWKQIETGLVVLGGCFVVCGEIYDWSCNIWGHEWIKGSPSHSNASALSRAPIPAV